MSRDRILVVDGKKKKGMGMGYELYRIDRRRLGRDGGASEG